MSSRQHLRNWSLAVFVNLLWAAQYPAYKMASDSMDVGALNFWTFVVAVVALSPFFIAERRRTGGKRLRRNDFIPFLLLAGVGIIPPSIVLSWGVAHSTASNGSILALATPMMMVGMAFVLLKERPQRFFLISVVLALAGTAVISWDDIASAAFTGNLLVGNVAILLGGAGAAFYNAYGKKVLESHTELEALIYGDVLALILCAVISLSCDQVPFYHITHWPLKAWLGVLVLGGMSWGLAMAIWMWLLKRLELTQVSVSVYLLPVLGVLLSALTLGERLTALQVIGGLVVLGSAYLCSAQPAAPSEART